MSKKNKVDLTAEQIERIEKMWGDGETASIICLETGLTTDVLRQRRKPGGPLAHLEKRQGKNGGNRRQMGKEFIPTPEHIETETRRIRERWTPDEERLRALGHAANPLVKQHRGRQEIERFGKVATNPLKPGRLQGR